MSKTANGEPMAQLWFRARDRERLQAIADREVRSLKDQFTVVISDACRSRGLDPDTLQPVAGTEGA